MQQVSLGLRGRGRATLRCGLEGGLGCQGGCCIAAWLFASRYGERSASGMAVQKVPCPLTVGWASVRGVGCKSEGTLAWLQLREGAGGTGALQGLGQGPCHRPCRRHHRLQQS